MRYLLQIIVMLIGPSFALAGIYAVINDENSIFLILLIIGFNYWAWKNGAWECWRPSVIKKFLENAKKAGL